MKVGNPRAPSGNIGRAELFGLAVWAFLLGLCVPVEGQQAKVPRIGFIAGTKGPVVATFQRALRDLGYTDGKNILIEYRYYEGRDDLIPPLVAELLQLKVDVLIVLTLPSIHEAKRATKTIPIVMVAGVDPVAEGLVDSFAQPGGNLTGVTRLFQELSGKRLELLRGDSSDDIAGRSAPDGGLCKLGPLIQTV